MADRVKVTVKGIPKVRKNFALLKRNSRKFVEDAVEKSADQIVATAREIVPFKEGRLMRTITQQKTAAPPGTVRHAIGADTDYAQYLEDPFAERRHRSRQGFIGELTPFLFPAARRNFKKTVDNITKAMKAAMRSARGV